MRYGPLNADLASGYFMSNEKGSISDIESYGFRHMLPMVMSRRRGGAATARPRISLEKRTGGGQREKAKADAEAGRNWRPERET
jgi:hypothetical protein